MIMNLYSHRAINTGKMDATTNELVITNVISEKPICDLPDVLTGTVTRTLNTEDTLEFTYPTNGENSNQLALRRIIEVKADPYRQTQYFRIQTIDKDINGVITVYAIHIVYDLIDHCVPVGFNLLTDTNGKYTMKSITKQINNDYLYPFIARDFNSDASSYQRVYSSGYFKYDGSDITIPNDFFENFGLLGVFTLREALFSDDNSLLNFLGGEMEFDRYMIKHRARIGKSQGFRVDQSINMTGFTYNRSCENIYSDILPYWKGSFVEGSVTYDGYVRKLCNASDTTTESIKFMGYDFNLYPYIEEDQINLLSRNLIPVYYRDSDGNKKRCIYTKILPVDITDIYNSLYGIEDGTTLTKEPSRVDVAACGILYILSNDLGNPTVSMTVDFADINASSEFEEYKDLNKLMLGDTVQIVNSVAGVVGEAECTSTKYNIITDMYDSLELGTPEVKFVETFVKASKKKKHYKTYYRKPTIR